MSLKDIGLVLFVIGMGYLLAFAAISGIQYAWIAFWEYGSIYNETTMPPLIAIEIFLSTVISSVILALFITPVGIIIMYYFLRD